MDGTLALIFAIFGVGELVDNHCPVECFARSDAPARVSAQIARTQFNRDWIGSEFALGYDFGRQYGPLQPSVYASYSDQGDGFVGIGAKWRIEDTASPFFIEAAFQPGYYVYGDGPDIGGNWHFRSALGLGYEFDNGASIIATYDHRSSGGLEDINPGIETLSIGYAITLD